MNDDNQLPTIYSIMWRNAAVLKVSGDDLPMAETDDEFQSIMKDLEGDAVGVAVRLQYLATRPIDDIRILPLIENFLDDRRACLLTIPESYGEIRWMAGEAVSAQRGLFGINEVVELRNVTLSLEPLKLDTLAIETGLERAFNIEDRIKLLDNLIASGKAPTRDRRFPPITMFRKNK